MNKQILFFTSAVVSLILIVALWSYTGAATGEIFGCVAKGGVLRIIGQGSRKENCTRNETSLDWNAQGEKGAKGDKGDPGEPGQQATSTIGAGDIAFIDEEQGIPVILKKDGTFWRYQGSWSNVPSHTVPIPTSNIVQWRAAEIFLDKDGSVWIFNGAWVNTEQP